MNIGPNSQSRKINFKSCFGSCIVGGLQFMAAGGVQITLTTGTQVLTTTVINYSQALVTGVSTFFLTNPNAWFSVQEFLLGAGGYDGLTPQGSAIGGLDNAISKADELWTNIVSKADALPAEKLEGYLGQYIGAIQEINLATKVNGVTDVGKTVEFYRIVMKGGWSTLELGTQQIDMIRRVGSDVFYGEIKGGNSWTSKTWATFYKSSDYKQLERYKEAADEIGASVEYYFPDGVSQEIVNGLNGLGIKSYDGSGNLLSPSNK